MQEKINRLIAQERWTDLIKCGSDAVDPLLNALHQTLEEHRQLEKKLHSREIYNSNHFFPHSNYLKTFSESRTQQEKIITIISTLGKIGDIRAWNPLVNLSNPENYEWPNQQISDAIEEIESCLQELKQKRNLYCKNCFYKFVRYPQVSSFVCLLSHKRRLSNLIDEKPFIPLLHSGPFSICRKCKSNKNYIENVNKVILSLDEMDVPFSFEDGLLTVNWFSIKMPVDMTEIAISHCTNDDVAELIMKLKNDDDPHRKRMYKNMPVSISKDLDLSIAKHNLLKNTFANIKIVENNTINKAGG